MNSTRVSSVELSAYVDTGVVQPLFFLMVLLLYVFTVGANVLLIVVVCVNRALHEPMYVFLCSLFVNEVFGSSGLFPFLLLQILSDVHTVSVPFCLVQVFCLYTYGSVEFTNLAVMSYDRYLAICYPLQYNTCMTSSKVTLLIAVIWLPPLLAVLASVCLTASLQLCGNAIHQVYCDNYSIIKLSCSDTTVSNVYELVAASVTFCAPVSVILYTYVRILQVCFSGSTQTRQKAVATCSPHLASLLNFFFGSFFTILQSRFNMSRVPNILRIFLSLYFFTCQPLFNPVIYGLNMNQIRIMCKRLVLASLRTLNK